MKRRVLLCLAAATVAGVILACGGPRPVAETPTPPPVWADPAEVARSGDVEVRVMKVVLGKVKTKRPGPGGREMETAADLLAVHLTLTNVSPEKKLSYTSWAGSGMAFQTAQVGLRDDLGNRYSRTQPAGLVLVVGAVESSPASVYPNKPVGDVILFEAPLDAAKRLDLELPCGNFGGRGFIRFRIPMTAVVRRAPG